MARAFTDTSELDLFANHLLDLAGSGVKRHIRGFVTTAASDVAVRMRKEAPSESGELVRSITVEIDDDGMGASVGPTATDEKGRPYPFFVEFGTSDTAPDPFVKRTSDWAAGVLPQRAADLLGDIL